MLFSTSSSLSMFAALWFLNGFAQGAGWPACAKLLKKVRQPACPLEINWFKISIFCSGLALNNLEHFGVHFLLLLMFQDLSVHFWQLGSLRNLTGELV